MPRIDRRNMLKAMAATAAGAAGAALSGSALQSVFAASRVIGGDMSAPAGVPASAITTTTQIATTPDTTYAMYPGSGFSAGDSTNVWTTTGVIAQGKKLTTSGSACLQRLDIPHGVTLTECKWFITNPTDLPQCVVWFVSLSGNSGNQIGGATAASTTTGIQAIDLTMTPTTIDNSQYAYLALFGAGLAIDNVLWGVRIGWLNNPGLTLFPNPRRIVDGFTMPFVYGGTYGPIDATAKSSGGASGVPAGAKAAFCAVQSYTAGVLTMFPDGTPDTGIANFTATTSGPLNLTYMMVPLSVAGKFKIHSYISGACIVDAWGFAI